MDNNNSWTNILYILAIVIFGIIKTISGKKANKQTSTPIPNKDNDTSIPKSKTILDTLFGDLFDEEIHPKETIEVVPEINEEKKKETIVSVRKPITKIDVQELSFDDTEQTDFSTIDDESIEFDLKQAVIQSEILNRKYC